MGNSPPLYYEELGSKLAKNWGKQVENSTGNMEKREGGWTLEDAWHVDVVLALTGFWTNNCSLVLGMNIEAGHTAKWGAWGQTWMLNGIELVEKHSLLRDKGQYHINRKRLLYIQTHIFSCPPFLKYCSFLSSQCIHSFLLPLKHDCTTPFEKRGAPGATTCSSPWTSHFQYHH